jgi:putative ABC transport system substrate-binding protein
VTVRRREFITLLGGAAAWPMAARAQQAGQLRRIVLIEGYGESDPEGQARFAAVEAGLRQLGWINGRNIKIESWFGVVGVDRLKEHATQLLALPRDVVVAGTTPITQTVQELALPTPIVFVNISNPIGTGVLSNFARPGGRATGFTNFEASMAGKWLELLKEVAPGTERFGILGNSQSSSASMFARSIETAAKAMRMPAKNFFASDGGQIEQQVMAVADEPRSGLVVLPDPLFGARRANITALALQRRLPAMYPLRFWASEGGLISYGVDQLDLYRRTATYVDRILKGEAPGDLPVQQPTKFELAVNLRTAKAIGLTIPETFLSRADEVIE